MLRLLATYIAHLLLASLLPTAVFACFVHDPLWWGRVVSAWRPWNDHCLFAALTTVVHHGLYFGTARRRWYRPHTMSHARDHALVSTFHRLLLHWAGLNSALYLSDARGWFREYKIPRSPQQTVSPALLKATLRGALLGGLFLQFPASIALYDLMRRFGSDISSPPPSTFTAYWQVCVAHVTSHGTSTTAS